MLAHIRVTDNGSKLLKECVPHVESRLEWLPRFRVLVMSPRRRRQWDAPQERYTSLRTCAVDWQPAAASCPAPPSVDDLGGRSRRHREIQGHACRVFREFGRSNASVNFMARKSIPRSESGASSETHESPRRAKTGRTPSFSPVFSIPLHWGGCSRIPITGVARTIHNALEATAPIPMRVAAERCDTSCHA